MIDDGRPLHLREHQVEIRVSARASPRQPASGSLPLPSTAFVLITGPEEQVLTEAEFFSDRMRSMQMPLGGVVFNRVHEELAADAATFRGGTVARVDEDALWQALLDARSADRALVLARVDFRRLPAARARRDASHGAVPGRSLAAGAVRHRANFDPTCTTSRA